LNLINVSLSFEIIGYVCILQVSLYCSVFIYCVFSGVMSTCAVTNASIPRGLVALPGHTGQVPNAIILSTGHIIPVATSTNSTLNTPSSSAVPHSTAGLYGLSALRVHTQRIYNIDKVKCWGLYFTLPYTRVHVSSY